MEPIIECQTINFCTGEKILIFLLLWELLAIQKKHKKENFEKIKLKKNKASYGQKKKQNKPNDKKAGNNV